MASGVRFVLLNNTWEVVERPKGRSVIDSRFVLRNKCGTNGALEKRKARIVRKGFSQQPGKDFQDTYAPVVHLSTICLAIALTARREMCIRQ